MTHKQLAAASTVSIGPIKRIENEGHVPKAPTLRLYNMPIWYVRSTDARISPKHAKCPSEPKPFVETPRQFAAPAPKSQSVYAQRRADRPVAARPSYDRPQYIEAGGKTWEVD